MSTSTSTAVTVRRHWGAFRTPWVVRQLSKYDTAAAAPPPGYLYEGSAEGAPDYARALVTDTQAFTTSSQAAVDLRKKPAPRLRRHRKRPLANTEDLITAPLDFAQSSAQTGGFDHSGSGAAGNIGGSGGGGSFLDGADELMLVIAIIAVALIVLVIAIPLGLIAIELVITLLLIGAGIAARLLHLKPWTVLIKREGTVAATVHVSGWRTSRALITALRTQLS